MAIRLQAEQTGLGVLLKRIGTQADAESIRKYLAEKGIAATIGSLAVGDYRVFLLSVTKEEFAKLIEGANVELIP